MPKNTPKSKPEVKRPRLTLSELASYDDICTDALVDNVFFWSTIRKNRQKYNSGRGFSEDAVTKILFDRIVCEEDMKAAEAELLKLGGFKKFLDRLKTPREQEDFKRHFRKYLSIWLPDCAWEVTTTNRYTIITQEAAVVARRDIKRGETINYLCGTLVEMTPEEEKDLDLTRRDFSIVTSSRSKKTSLFLGPARFANHDCRSNARLTTIGSLGMSVVASRLIHKGEEITVTYGDDYFGERNCECLCGSCEQAGIGGWTKPEMMPTTEKSMTPVAIPQPYSFRRSRRNQRDSFSPITPDPETFVAAGRRRSSSGRSTPSGSSTPTSTAQPSSIKKTLARVSSRLARYSPDVNHEEAIEEDEQTGVAKNESVLDAPPLPATSESEFGNVIVLPKHESILDAPPLLVTSESEFKNTLADPKIDDSTAPIIKQEEILEDIDRSALYRGVKRALTTEGDGDSTANLKRRRLSESDLAHIPVDGDQMSSTGPASSSTASEISRKRDADHLDVSQISPRRPRPDIIEALKAGPLASPTSEDSESLRRDPRRSTSPPSVFEKDHTTQIGSPLSSQADGQLDIPPNVKLEEHSDIATNRLVQLEQTLNDDSDLSELDSDEDFDDDKFQIVRRKKKRANNLKSRKQSNIPLSPEIPRTRTPGDYVNTPILLAEPYARWVQCKTCDSVWVQANGYYTRRECPRCERHSKLYGYRWPKVHDDKNERISDHRTVHRFLSTTEEEGLRNKIKARSIMNQVAS